MTDHNINGPIPRVRTQPKAEFYTYFAIIFVAALPVACLSWGLASLRQKTIKTKGPIARAWTQARIITPMIFSA